MPANSTLRRFHYSIVTEVRKKAGGRSRKARKAFRTNYRRDRCAAESLLGYGPVAPKTNYSDKPNYICLSSFFPIKRGQVALRSFRSCTRKPGRCRAAYINVYILCWPKDNGIINSFNGFHGTHIYII